ncbi:hypothetical protein [Rhodopseudomonas palustris]|uniref:Bacterial microcompartment domain-containing protein n=1 Tax=Rhodopseudomonas palustris (strain BisB18) TaxID=316056 RepID=Q21A48_RHOPB
MTTRIINAPLPEVVDMLERRMRPDARHHLSEIRFDSVGLLQTSVADLFYYADLAGKASGVFTAELFGSCPQNVSTLALFGETAAVRIAIEAIEADGASF